MIASTVSLSASSLDHAQSAFVAAMPGIVRLAKRYFRHVRCQHRKDDFVSEVVSICWKWWVRLVELGTDPARVVGDLAVYAARAVRRGRRVCGKERVKDVMSPVAQQRQGFTVHSLRQVLPLNTNPLSEALTDNTVSPVPDQVQFRCDFPEWLGTHSPTNRVIAIEMAWGERTKALARRFKISPARVSQLRRELHRDWRQFTDGEQTAA